MNRRLDNQWQSIKNDYMKACKNYHKNVNFANAFMTSFKNPYGKDVQDSHNKIMESLKSFIPLIKQALKSGYGFRYINHRLPTGFKFWIDGNKIVLSDGGIEYHFKKD